MLIYLSGVLAGISCGYLILSTTFRKNSPLYDVSISMWGFRGPLGAFICAWGGVAMIASAPFDNWWHNSYGLDVKILSPPHVLLALGMIGIRFGLLVMVLAEMNRAEGIYRQRLERILFVTVVFLMGMTVGIAQEFTNRVFMHGAKFYLVIMIAAPIWIATVAWVAKHRWAATIMTAMFTALHLCFVWGFPLIPAEPKLGPVYQHITHLVPPDFPALLIIPAIVFDLLRQRTADWSRWKQAATLGAAFLGELRRSAMAFRHLPYVSRFTKQNFPDHQFSLFCSAHIAMGSQHLHSHRAYSRAILDSYAGRAVRVDSDGAYWHDLGCMDAANPPMKEFQRRLTLFCILFVAAAIPALAHVGSPDVYYEGDAGPYHLFVTVRIPQVVPGVAEIEVRCQKGDVNAVQIVPLRLSGPGSTYPPTPDFAVRSMARPAIFHRQSLADGIRRLAGANHGRWCAR